MHQEEVRARNLKNSPFSPIVNRDRLLPYHTESLVAIFIIVKYLFPEL